MEQPPTSHAQKLTSWQNIAWLMLSDIVGTSVLTLTGVTVQLGWVLSACVLVGLFLPALYTSLLMCRTRAMLCQIRDLRTVQESSDVPFNSLGSMGEVAFIATQSPCARSLVYLAVYGCILLGQGSYLLVLGNTLQMAFYSTALCLPVAVSLGCATLIVPCFLIRRIGDSILLCFINTLLIAAVIFLALFDLGSHKQACTQTYAFAPKLTFGIFMGTVTNVVYAFAGQWMYFELMDTMEQPDDFPKVFIITGPFMLGAYLSVALVGYAFGAGSADLISSMQHGPNLRITAVLLFAHVIVVYLIRSVVLARYFHTRCHPEDVDSTTISSYFRHGAWGFLMLCFSFLVANAVPFFSQLLGLIGGLLAGPVNFLLPMALYLVAKGRWQHYEEHRAKTSEDTPLAQYQVSPALYGNNVSTTSFDDLNIAMESVQEDQTSASCPDTASTSNSGLLVQGFLSLAGREQLLILSIFALVLLTMAVGVAEDIAQVLALAGIFGAPFACHELQAPVLPTCGD